MSQSKFEFNKDEIGVVLGTGQVVVRQRPQFIFSFIDELETLCKEATGDILNVNQFLPTQADPEATGYDVRSASLTDIVLTPGNYIKVPLGFKMFAPPGWWMSLAPRSSTFTKLNIHALYGVIDECFPDQMFFVGQYLPDQAGLVSAAEPKVIKFGDRISQVIPVFRQEMTIATADSKKYKQLVEDRNAVRKSGFGASGQR